MNDPLILVTGASGKTGSAITQRLRSNGARLRLASRSLDIPGAADVHFDWNDPTTFEAALSDVERIYLLAPTGDNAPLRLVAPFIDKALLAGVKRFVLLSSTQLHEGGPAMGQIHAYLRQVAPEWAVLRPSWFMQNFINEPHLSTIVNEGAIYSATADGRVPFVSVEDIAEVGARVLLQSNAPEHDLIITGPKLLGYDDIARTISTVTGKSVHHVRLSENELSARYVRFGLPKDYADTLAKLDGLIASGVEEKLSEVVPRIAGRPAASFSEFAKLHVTSWR